MHVVLARYCYRKSSVRLSVCDIVVPQAYVLRSFELTNYTNNQLRVFAPQSHNIDNLVQEEHA